jgi:hypothetical protein
LEGTKVWRFVAPTGISEQSGDDRWIDLGVTKVDKLLNSYRLPSVVWDSGGGSLDDQMYLSSGWQSDYSLYDYGNDKIDSIPSAEEFASMDESQKYEV